MARIRSQRRRDLHGTLGGALRSWTLASGAALPRYALRHGVPHLHVVGALDDVQRVLDDPVLVGAAAEDVGDVEVGRWLAATPDSGRGGRWAARGPGRATLAETRAWLAVSRLLLAGAEPVLAAELAGALAATVAEAAAVDTPVWRAHEQHARAWMAAGRHERAREAAGGWLARAVTVAGEESMLAARAWWLFALLEDEAGDGGAEILGHVAAIAREAGAPPIELMRIDADLARALAAADDHDDALVLAKAVLAARRRELGDQHPDVVASLGLLGDLRARVDDMRGARRHWRAAITLARSLHGPDHPVELRLEQEVWRAAAAAGQVRQANTGFAALIRRWDARGGAPPAVAITLVVDRARCVAELLSPQAGVALVSRALARAGDELSIAVPGVLEARHLLGEMLEDAGAVDASLAQRRETAEMLAAAEFVNRHDVHEAWDRLGDAALRLRRPREALFAYRALLRELRADRAVDATSVCRLGRAEVAAGLIRAGVRTLQRGLRLAVDDPDITPQERRAARRALQRTETVVARPLGAARRRRR